MKSLLHVALVLGTLAGSAGSMLSGKANLTSQSASCNLNGASPSICTVSVTAGAKCAASIVGTTQADAAKGIAVNLSGTTLTVTSANGANNTVNVWCDQ